MVSHLDIVVVDAALTFGFLLLRRTLCMHMLDELVGKAPFSQLIVDATVTTPGWRGDVAVFIVDHILRTVSVLDVLQRSMLLDADVTLVFRFVPSCIFRSHVQWRW